MSVIESRLYKCYPYKRYNFIYVKKILLPYKNTIGKTSKSKPNHAYICIRIRKQNVASVRDARCRCREASHSSHLYLVSSGQTLVSPVPRLICHYTKLGLSHMDSTDPA